MKTLKEQTDAKVQAGREANPDFMKNVDEIIAKAKKLQQGDKAIELGKIAPNFVLPNPKGVLISLTNLLTQGPVVVTFYRGSWCPYCNIQLKALQDRLDDIHTLGAQLVAISPQVPDNSLTPDEINKMGFIILSDQDANVASQYGVGWKVPEFLIEHMKKDRNLDLEAINNGNGSILPIPATFVIDRNGTITWRFVDVDYRTRSEPEDIIKALRELSKK
ncbi:peroxiredoxin-like family protein [Colwellia sp. 20A7]|uniref:peroxiredoxin-like family protein n=1 Tax=Colwellia sp. 20A7 TaxID=2689569 RepID=UPI001358284B|nr:peroxiredoxin-like family protein [Colwellia sp. 20A7]